MRVVFLDCKHKCFKTEKQLNKFDKIHTNYLPTIPYIFTYNTELFKKNTFEIAKFCD